MPKDVLANLRASGLWTQPNQLEAPPGGLIEANNVIIRRDNVIEPRRGMKLYGTQASSAIKQLLEYKDRILRHVGTTLQWDTEVENLAGESIFNTFSGSFQEVEEGLRIKGLEANGNFYFTTNDGIKKISATNADEFTTDAGYITNAGAPKALDIEAVPSIELGSNTGFLPVDSTVAYRVVWGNRDVNNNVVLGVPSSRSVVTVSLLEVLLQDFVRVLHILDVLNQSGSLITDGDYFETLGLPISASATQLQTNLIDLTQKIDQDLGTLFDSSDISSASVSSNIMTITMNGSGLATLGKLTVGDRIFLEGTWTGSGNEDLSGLKTVLSIDVGSTNDNITVTVAANNGSVTLSGESITYGWFRSITEPGIPSTPATHTQLENLQTYLQSTIEELQSSRNVKEIAKNDGISTANPMEITTSTITSNVVTIDIDAAANPQDFLEINDLIDLTGVWEDDTGQPFARNYSVSSVSSSSFLFASSNLSDGNVTISTTSITYRVQRFTEEIQIAYIDDLEVTTTTNVLLDINIPYDVTVDDFYQIYRSSIVTATGTDIIGDLQPSDELRLIYEAFPTQAEVDARFLQVEDVVPDTFFLGAANLYTNEDSGEGILQANDPPPLAKDLNSFKNHTFYANTRTLNRFSLFLLGVSDIIEDYDNGLKPKFTVTDGTTTNEYTFTKGIQEMTNITCPVATSLNGKYLDLYSAEDSTSYRFFYNTGITDITDGTPVTITSNGHGLSNGDSVQFFATNCTPSIDGTYSIFSVSTNTFDITPTTAVNDPGTQGQWMKIFSGKQMVKVDVNVVDANTVVADKTLSAIGQFNQDFSVSVSTNIVTVTNVKEGVTTNASGGPSSGFTFTYTEGAGEKIEREITALDFSGVTGASFTSVGNGDFFRINTPFDRNLYYVWYNVDAGNSVPSAANPGRTAVAVAILSGDTGAQIATKTQTALDALGTFSTSLVTAVLTVTTTDPGPVIDATSNTMPGAFVLTIETQGALEILLSNLASPSLAVDETARSLVKVINRNSGETINAYYLSGINDVPGRMFLESRSLQNTEFYLLTNQIGTGESFNPSLAPSFTILTNTAADPTVISVTGHGLVDGDQVVISNSNSVPSIDGLYEVFDVTINTFSIDVNVLTAGTTGSIQNADIAEVSNNETRPNRIYYSKLQQPEAVPQLNFLEVGATSKQILRIFPLRDTLFIFKEDGIYRISGENTPFNLAVFDNTAVLLAPDSIDSSNNLIYGWFEQGISTVSESDIKNLSRPFDIDILPLSTPNYPNFKTATWGIGYDSDSSYIVWTIEEQNDIEAQQAFRYSQLTDSWTRWPKGNTCGLIKDSDDLIYAVASDVDYIEQERKNFNRTDYADRQIEIQLTANSYTQDGRVLLLGTLENIEPNYAVTQEQTVTVYDFNQLLKKLDLDSGINETDFFSTLEAMGGDNMRDKLEELAIKLDANSSISIIHEFSPSDVDTGTETITIANHGYTNGLPIQLSSTGTLPSPLTTNTTYYIISSMTNTFQLSTLIGGSAVNFTTTGSGIHTIQEISYSHAIINRVNFAITSNSDTNPTIITSPSHGLVTGRKIAITGVSGSVPSIDSEYIVTKISDNTFSIPVAVLTPGTGGTFTTLVDNFEDMETCYNQIITLLNNDDDVSFNNYMLIESTTLLETTILSTNINNDSITLRTLLPFIVGPLIIYESIESNVIYVPQTMGDPIGLKHVSDVTAMFSNRTFTEFTFSFATDLLPDFEEVILTGSGPGLFGNDDFGNNTFGGDSFSAPFRTLIPRNKQRCRYMVVQIYHNVAREKYSLYGISLIGSVSQSHRAYR